MRLPDEIPRELRQNALILPGLLDGQGAWSREDALEVVASLEGTMVAVSEVTPFHRVTWGTEVHWSMSDTVWSVHRQRSESEIDYARRSRREAVAFLGDYEECADELFALTFPMWKDAA